MTDHRLTVHPEDMARAGEALREPGELLRKAFRQLAARRGQTALIWSSGDPISDSLTENMTPRVEGLDQHGEALIIAFDLTADQVLRSARGYDNSEEAAWSASDDLNSPTGGPDGGRR